MTRRGFFAIVDREFQTVLRTRLYLALALGFVLVMVTLAWASGAAGYVPVALSLLTPTEVLVPVLAMAFGYRAILGDVQRGELELLRTFPVSRPGLVIGVYLGRAAALLPVVIVALVVAGLLVPLTGGAKTTVIASHAGADTILLYLRFVVLTAMFTLVALAVAIVVSTTARGLRGAIVLGIGFIILLVVGLDLGLVAALGGGLPEWLLQWVLGASPNSAYRGLVLRSMTGPVTTAGVRSASPIASLIGLLVWWFGALALAARTVWS